MGKYQVRSNDFHGRNCCGKTHSGFGSTADFSDGSVDGLSSLPLSDFGASSDSFGAPFSSGLTGAVSAVGSSVVDSDVGAASLLGVSVEPLTAAAPARSDGVPAGLLGVSTTGASAFGRYSVQIPRMETEARLGSADGVWPAAPKAPERGPDEPDAPRPAAVLVSSVSAAANPRGLLDPELELELDPPDDEKVAIDEPPSGLFALLSENQTW